MQGSKIPIWRQTNCLALMCVLGSWISVQFSCLLHLYKIFWQVKRAVTRISAEITVACPTSLSKLVMLMLETPVLSVCTLPEKQCSGSSCSL